MDGSQAFRRHVGRLAITTLAGVAWLGLGPGPGRAQDRGKPDPLASLVPEPNARLTFSYRRTEDTELEIQGGKGGIGAVKNIDRIVTEADGKILVTLPETASTWWADFFPSPGPAGRPVSVLFDPHLSLTMMTDAPRSFTRDARLSGTATNQRFTMNTWGPPSPKWLRTTIVHNGQSMGTDNVNDVYNLSVSLGDPVVTPAGGGKVVRSFRFKDPEDFVRFQYIARFPTTDDVTEEHFRPENARNTEVMTVPRTVKGSGRIDVVLPRKSEEMEEARSRTPLPGQLWSREVALSATGIRVTGTHGWTIIDPPHDNVTRSVKRIWEKVTVEFSSDAVPDGPRSRGAAPSKK